MTEAPRGGSDDALLVSPELALVDPELARLARALLPDADEFSFERGAAETLPEPPPAPSRERAAARRRRLVLLAAAATAAVIAAAVLTLKSRDGTSQVAKTPTTSAAATAPSRERASTAERRSGVPARPSAQTFSWATVPGAKSYEFELFKGPARIFEARSSQARLTLPVTWTYGSSRVTLVPGQYRWLVRPVLGSKGGARLGPTIVDARLVVGR